MSSPVCFSWPMLGRGSGDRDAEQSGPIMTDTIMPPVHPGEILLTEFLEPLGVGLYQLAKAVDVPACLLGIRQGISPLSDRVQLCLLLGSPSMWPVRDPWG